MRRQRRTLGALLFAGLAGWAGQAQAQALGPFTWQLQPFCNRVTVQVTQNGAVYTMDGFDDQCAAGQRAPVVGVATPNPDGTIGFGWTVVTAPGGKPVHVDARIDLTSIGGPWTDSAGNSGTLVLGGPGTGSPRPVPTGVPAGSVGTAALVTGAVTGAAIADGTIGAADIDSTAVQRRITGGCAIGQFFIAVNSSGTPLCGDGGGAFNAALGAGALNGNSGSFNTALGDGAIANGATGGNNTAAGSSALGNATTGSSNTAFGSYALAASNGWSNVAVGVLTLGSATSGGFNTAVGTNAMLENETGSAAVAVGHRSLANAITASGNVAVGYQALVNASGNNNTALGFEAGKNVTIGINNIHIGNAGLTGDINTIKIGTAGTQTTAYLAGVRGVTTVTSAIPVLVGTDGQLGTTSSSRRVKDDIQDMGDRSARVLQLRPVTFRYKREGTDSAARPLEFGLVAEEVADVFPELTVRSADGQIETVAYHTLPTLLLNELQKQQRTIDALLERVRALESTRERR